MSYDWGNWGDDRGAEMKCNSELHEPRKDPDSVLAERQITWEYLAVHVTFMTVRHQTN